MGYDMDGAAQQSAENHAQRVKAAEDRLVKAGQHTTDPGLKQLMADARALGKPKPAAKAPRAAKASATKPARAPKSAKAGTAKAGGKGSPKATTKVPASPSEE